MGLNEMYGHARSQILMMNPLPSVGKAYAMIISDESQRVTSGMRTTGDVIEAAALYAGRENYSRDTRYDGGKGEYNGRTKKKVNWNLFCDHCKIYGHTQKNCFKLIGYPEDWKFKKKVSEQGGEQSYTNPVRGMNSSKGKNVANNV